MAVSFVTVDLRALSNVEQDAVHHRGFDANVLPHSLDGAAASFRPLKLEYGLTPQKVYATLRQGNYGQVLTSCPLRPANN